MNDGAGAELPLRTQILENQKLIDRLNEELARKHHEVRVIQQISSEISSTLDLNHVLRVALKAMDEVLGFEHAMILLKDPEGDRLQVAATRGFAESGLGAEVALGQGIIGMAARRRRIVRMGNIQSQLAYTAAVRQRMVEQGLGAGQEGSVPLPGLANVNSQIAIPLQIKDRLIGVLSVESDKPAAYDQLDEMLLTILANQAASVIDNARLYQADQARLDELNAAYLRLNELNERLETKVVERTRELSVALVQVEAEQRRGQELLERMVPGQVIPLLLADQLLPRRLNATILFTDLEGFTEYSSRLEPDEVFSQLNYFFTQVGDQIDVFRGYVNKTAGDSIMALFGVPNQRPTHAIDAVLAGLRIQSDLERHQSLNMRVGINSGVVTAGMLGPGDKSRYDVLGDAVNAASRMEHLCRPGGVTITESTFRLVEPYFEIRPLDPQEVKGKGTTQIYEVVGLRPVQQDRRRFDESSRFSAEWLGVFDDVYRLRERFDVVDFLSVQTRDGALQHNEAAAGIGLALLRFLRQQTDLDGLMQAEIDRMDESELVTLLLLHDLGKHRVDPEELTDPALAKEGRRRLSETLRVQTCAALETLDLAPLQEPLNRLYAYEAARGDVGEVDAFTLVAATADVYDALTAPKVYKGKPWSVLGALEEISRSPYALRTQSPVVRHFVELMRPCEREIKATGKSSKLFR